MTGEINEIKIPVPWGTIAGKTYGNKNNYPVLALHGYLDNCGTFDKLIPRLPKSLYYVSIDIPGHGLSSQIPKGIPFYYMDLILMMKRVTNYFRWPRFSILGHSLGAGMGAVFASAAAAYNKSGTGKEEKVYIRTSPGQDRFKLKHDPFPNVDKLVMIDLLRPFIGTDENYPEKIGTAVQLFLANEEKIDSGSPPSYPYPEIVQKLIKGSGNILTEEAAKTLLIRGAREINGKWSFNHDNRLKCESLLRVSDQQVFNMLQGIRTNVLFIKFKQSSWYTPESDWKPLLESYKKNCSSFSHVDVDGNHFDHLNYPEKISDLVAEFLLKENQKNN